MRKTKTRVLQQEGSSSRSASRSREPGPEEEQSSSKAQKPSPRSPPHPVVGEEEGEGKEGWPALPSPGGKVGPQVPILTPGSQKTPSPPKDPKGPKGPGAQHQPSTGANSPLKDSSASKGPENQPQPTPSQEAHKAEGLKSGLQKPGLSGKGPLSSWRTTKHPEDDSASKGPPQKGPNSGGQTRVTKETSKPLGPHLKAPPPLTPHTS